MDADVLGMLEKLQEVADEMDRLEARRRGAVQAKEKADASLQEASQLLTGKEERARAVDMERRKRELVLKAEKDRMARVKGRLGDVKTSREYQAVLQEIASAKHAITDQEEAQLQEMQELETMESEIAGLRGELQTLGERLRTAEQELARVLGETDAAVAECKGQESSILKSLPREAVDRYRLIRSRRGGLAVVPAKNEACTACFMRLPPQMYIEVMRRTKVIQCPNCHRILIPPKVQAEE